MQFILWDKGSEQGPYDLDAVQNSIRQGRFSSKVLARLSTGTDWRPLETLLPRQAVSTPKVEIVQQPKRRAKPLVCECPKCGSDSIQSAPVVYESGVSSFSGQTTGVGVSGIGGEEVSPMMGRGWTQGTTVSALSQRFAPPQPMEIKSLTGPIALMIVVPIFFLLFQIIIAAANDSEFSAAAMLAMPGIIAAMFGAVALRRKWDNQLAQRYNEGEYRALFVQWEESWFCHRCGFFGPLE